MGNKIRTNCWFGRVFSTGIFAITVLLSGVAVQANTTEYFNHSNFSTATSDLTVIDFDDLSSGNGAFNGDEFVSSGVTIVQRDGHPINVLRPQSDSLNNINSLPHGITSSFFIITSNSNGFDDSITDNIDFIFSTPSTSAGLWIGNIGPGQTEVQFLDENEQIIASETIDQGHAGLVGTDFNSRIFYGITTDQMIGRIRTLELTNDGDGIMYDDLQFRTIPEPATASIIAFGAIGLLRRRIV